MNKDIILNSTNLENGYMYKILVEKIEALSIEHKEIIKLLNIVNGDMRISKKDYDKILEELDKTIDRDKFIRHIEDHDKHKDHSKTKELIQEIIEVIRVKDNETIIDAPEEDLGEKFSFEYNIRSNNRLDITMIGEGKIIIDWGNGEDLFEGNLLPEENYPLTTFIPTKKEIGTFTCTIRLLNGNSITNFHFNSSSAIKSIKTPMFSTVTSLEDLFGTNSNMDELIAEDLLLLFSNCPNLTSVEAAFYRSNIKNIPEGLFDKCPNITSFYRCFEECHSLRSIPKDLFKNASNATDIRRCFFECEYITAIPEGLFDNCPNLIDLGGCFLFCERIRSIPEGLFDNCPNLKYIASCFSNTSVGSIPEGLFDKNINLIHVSYCFSHTDISSIPEGLFDNCPNITYFNGCFGYCGITTIPEGLFNNCNVIYTVDGCFDKTNITSIPEGLFNSSSNSIELARRCFSSCANLTTIPEGLFNNFSKLLDVEKCFDECTSLISIPEDLFSNCPNVTSFGSCFYGCVKLQTAPKLYDNISDFPKLKYTKDCYKECRSLPDYPYIPIDWGGLGQERPNPALPEDQFSFTIRSFDRDQAIAITSLEDSILELNKDGVRSNINLIANTETIISLDKSSSIVTDINITLTKEHNKSIIQFRFDTEETDTYLKEIKTSLWSTVLDISRLFSSLDLRLLTTDSLKVIFSNCPNVTNLSHCFTGSKHLTVLFASIFDNFINATDFSDCFRGCDWLMYIPTGLFDKNINVTEFECCFFNCININSIPKGLFDNCPNVIGFNDCFRGSGIMSIPERLFDKNINVISFGSCFMECPNLMSNVDTLLIPRRLFSNCHNATEFSHCFEGCPKIITLPAVFSGVSNTAYFNTCFSKCTNLTTIDPQLFQDCINATEFSYCFEDCTSLVTIPEKLFETCYSATDFNRCFLNCENITTIPEDMFINTTNVTDFSHCFDNCSKLTIAPSLYLQESNYPNLAGANGKYSCYNNCTKLPDYPYIPIDWGGLGQERPNPSLPEDQFSFIIQNDGINTPVIYITALENSNLELNNNGIRRTISLVANNVMTIDLDYSSETDKDIHITLTKEHNANIVSVKFHSSVLLKEIKTSLWNTVLDVSELFLYMDMRLLNTDSLEILFSNSINITNFNKSFSSCSNLTSIPSGLFINNINALDFGECFMFSDDLINIPEGLFDNCVNATSFSGCFHICNRLTAIPEGLFDNCVNATSFSGCFFDCNSLTTIPIGLFSNCPNATRFNMCFYNCTSLTTLPEGLFDNCVNATDFSNCFEECTSLIAISEGLFDDCVNATSFSNCFGGCESILSIHEDLFKLNTKVYSFYTCFYQCIHLTNAPKLYEQEANYPQLRLFGVCYYNCTSLPDYPYIPTAWGGLGQERP